MSSSRGVLALLLLPVLSLCQNIGHFLVVSDIHYAPEQNSNPPSPTDIQFGADSPLWLLNSTAYAMASSLVPGPNDFILNTGDLMSHALSSKTSDQAWPYASQILAAINNSFTSAFGESNKFLTSPIFALGNNDLYPKYAAPGTTPQWFASVASQVPSLNYNQDSLNSFLINGSYTIDVPTTSGSFFIRIIVLHTNYWSISNVLDTNDSDPGGVFAFLSTALQSAQQQGVKVYIMGHVPPGIDHYAGGTQWQPRFVPTYVNLITPYLQNTILAQFFGHEHVSLFRLLSGSSSGSSISNPGAVPPIHLHSSISPVYSNNPQFRQYSYNRDTGELIDFATWYLNFEASPSAPVWQLQFPSALDRFRIPNLKSDGFCTFIQNMYQNASLTTDYVDNSFSFATDESATCDPTCRNNTLCDSQFLVLADYQSCVENGTILPCAQPSSTTGNTASSVLPGVSVAALAAFALL